MVRRSLVLDLPRNLIIHVRRFNYTDSGLAKDCTPLLFPLRLCMDEFTIKKVPKADEEGKGNYYSQLRRDQAKPEDVYDLYGVVTHQGTIDDGHYVCYISMLKKGPQNRTFAQQTCPTSTAKQW